MSGEEKPGKFQWNPGDVGVIDDSTTVDEKSDSDLLLEEWANKEYEFGWTSDIESEQIEPGLSEDTVRRISAKKNEPEWMLEWRLKAFRHFLTMKEPTWQNVDYTPVDLQSISYYSAPKKKPVLDSLEDADPEILKTFQKLGIPVEEQKVLLNVKGAAASAADALKPPPYATQEHEEGVGGGVFGQSMVGRQPSRVGDGELAPRHNRTCQPRPIRTDSLSRPSTPKSRRSSPKKKRDRSTISSSSRAKISLPSPCDRRCNAS